MFLSSCRAGDGLHELDFRFEVFSEGEGFLFAHHGAKLNELLEACGDGALGSTFYMVELMYPLSLPDVIASKELFRNRYGVEPDTVYDKFLRFDLETLAIFFESTKTDNELDCVIVGTDEPVLAEQILQQFLDSLTAGPSHVPLAGLRSWLRTHDNHFLWLAAKPVDVLRRLIATSLLGFFDHVHHHRYTPVPDSLVELVLSKYHTAPLVCVPTGWDSGKASEVTSGVEEKAGGIRALIETKESSWIAYKLDPPKELIGRGLLISYEFRSESWSFEEWC
jgi:hypothetical protein